MKKDLGEILGGILLVISIAVVFYIVGHYGAVKKAQFDEAQYKWQLSWADRM